MDQRKIKLMEYLYSIGKYCEDCKYFEISDYDGRPTCRNAPRMKDDRIKFSIINNTVIAGMCEDYQEVD